jgi:hypothetical protein
MGVNAMQPGKVKRADLILFLLVLGDTRPSQQSLPGNSWPGG